MHDKEYKQGYEAGQGSALVDAGVVPTSDKVANYQMGVRLAVQELLKSAETPEQAAALTKGKKKLKKTYPDKTTGQALRAEKKLDLI